MTKHLEFRGIRRTGQQRTRILAWLSVVLLAAVVVPSPAQAAPGDECTYGHADVACDDPESGETCVVWDGTKCVDPDVTGPGSPTVVAKWDLDGECVGQKELVYGEVGGGGAVTVAVWPITIAVSGEATVGGDYAVEWSFSCEVNSIASAHGKYGFFRVVEITNSDAGRADCNYTGFPDDSCGTPPLVIGGQDLSGSGVAIVGQKYPTSVQACWTDTVMTVTGYNRGVQGIGDEVSDPAPRPGCETYAIDYSGGLGVVPLLCEDVAPGSCEGDIDPCNDGGSLDCVPSPDDVVNIACQILDTDGNGDCQPPGPGDPCSDFPGGECPDEDDIVALVCAALDTDGNGNCQPDEEVGPCVTLGLCDDPQTYVDNLINNLCQKLDTDGNGNCQPDEDPPDECPPGEIGVPPACLAIEAPLATGPSDEPTTTSVTVGTNSTSNQTSSAGSTESNATTTSDHDGNDTASSEVKNDGTADEETTNDSNEATRDPDEDGASS